MNWKRIALLIGFILAVFIIGYSLYYFFLKPSVPSQPGTNTNITPGVNGGLPTANINGNIQVIGNTNGALPGGNINGNTGIIIPGDINTDLSTISPVANGGLTLVKAITSTTASNSTISSDGTSAIYYDPSSGTFNRITPNGTVVPYSDKIFYNVEQVTWSPEKEKAILEYPDGSNILYNFETNEQVTLPKHWKEFSFDPSGDKIALKSMAQDPENRWIAVANSDGSKATRIEHLGDKDATVDINWSPSNQIVAMYREDKDFNRQDLYFVGLNQENFKSTIIPGRGFEGQWSTNGDLLLYSVYSSDSGYKPTLWMVKASGDSIGENRRSLRLETWVDKCTFHSNTVVYCAVPRSLEEGSGIFSDDLDTSPTDVYKVDLSTGLRTKIATPAIDINMENLFVTENEQFLYFNNKEDGKLYSIQLK